ncbi:hypothetical protein [Spiroplasma endosymbiont of Nephrotoma flavescens]|uniref:hypothetical protein n=1 Tax=Spiroplasma endosymbiont of Nephrotoma flavescens TaxID=3066302 RepID=UPI00313ED037
MSLTNILIPFIKIINLGNIENIDNQNNYQEILERFINVNSNNNNIPVELLTLQNLHVIPNSVTENSAIISLSNYGLYGARLNFDYYGAILVTFNTLEQELSICEETNTITKEDSDDDDKQNNNFINIGRISNNSPEEIIPIILNYIKEQHKISINRQSIKIDYIFEDLLEININSIDPEFNITFFIEFDTNFFLVNDIQNIIVTNDLGLLENHEPNERGAIIINEFMRLNNLNEIESINLTLNNITENTAIISINPRNSSDFFGKVQVNFRLDSNTNQNINQNNVNNQNNFGGSCSGGSSTNKKKKDTFFTKDWSSDSDNECEQTNFNNKQFNSDGIEKWYKFLQPDQLKIDINKETWDKEIKPHIQKIINVVGKFPVSDHSSFKKFNEENRNMMVGSIAYNYTKINDIFLKNNVKYLVIDKTIGHIFLDKSFYYTDYYDYVIEQESEHSNSIEKWYKFLQPDQLKIGINKETWNKEIKPHIQKIINVVGKFPVSDHSFVEKYNEQDRNTLISFLIRHFIEINDYFQSSNSLIFSTDTYGINFDIEKIK